jgi:hypothetical protein
VNPEAPVQRQLDAYNAQDLERFLTEYADDIQIFRLPNLEPAISGKRALAEFYADRFKLPELHAELINRTVLGNKVVDHERITGAQPAAYDAVAVYEVVGNRISNAWFFLDNS